MKKVLFTATVDSHILHFHMPHIQWFKDQGYEVHVASRGVNHLPGVDQKFNVPFERQPLKADSWEAYKVLKLLVQTYQYDIIHCHTPMGAVITRLASIGLRKGGTKVLYTAHGFHFFEGAPAQNWLIYYPIEKFLSSVTDCLITINQEDFNIAKERQFRAQDIRFVHGVGVNMDRFQPATPEEKQQLREHYGFQNDDVLMIYVGELSQRKNQTMLIEAMRRLKQDVPQAKLLLVGKGDLDREYRNLIAFYGLEESVLLLGYRTDVDQLMKVSDIAVSAARQEGLPVNVMEAMASGLPMIVTNCRGNRDLVRDNINGYVVEIDDVATFAQKIQMLVKNQLLRERFGRRGAQLMQLYSLPTVMKELDVIYSSYMLPQAKVPIPRKTIN